MATTAKTWTEHTRWAQSAVEINQAAVVYIETEDKRGHIGIGTGFHVGEGVFLTAAHVVRDRKITNVGRDDGATIAAEDDTRTSLDLVDGPYFHSDERIDVACFRAKPLLNVEISLRGHLDDWLPGDGFVLHRTLIMGYPPIPLSNRPCLFAQSGEVNALIDKGLRSSSPDTLEQAQRAMRGVQWQEENTLTSTSKKQWP